MTLIGIFSQAFWYIAPILVALTTSITGFVNQLFKIENATAKQVVSWIVGALLSIGAWGFGFITLSEPTWLALVALAFVVGLSSNGLYDIKAIKNWIDKWFNQLSQVPKN